VHIVSTYSKCPWTAGSLLHKLMFRWKDSRYPVGGSVFSAGAAGAIKGREGSPC
jgi:hypothetical protein